MISASESTRPRLMKRSRVSALKRPPWRYLRTTSLDPHASTIFTPPLPLPSITTPEEKALRKEAGSKRGE